MSLLVRKGLPELGRALCLDFTLRKIFPQEEGYTDPERPRVIVLGRIEQAQKSGHHPRGKDSPSG
jgi:hypothetical protein